MKFNNEKAVVKLAMLSLLLFISSNAFGGGSTTYYFKAQLAGKTGEGKVYGSSNDVAPKESDYKETFGVPEWSYTQSGVTDVRSTASLYLYAQPESGYILKNWTMGNQTVGLDNKTLAPIQGYTTAKIVNYVANFVSSDTQLGKYYRVKNVSTGKYVGLVNNKQLDYLDLIQKVGGGLSQAPYHIDKIYQALGDNYIGVDINMVQDEDLTDVGDVLFLRDASASQYDVVGQGTSLNHLAQGTYPGKEYITFYNNFAKFTKRDAGNYLISLKPNCDNSTGNGLFTDSYFYDNGGKFALNHKKPENETDEYHWLMEPVEYFCVKPLNENIKDGNGYYWTTLVTAFPYQIPSNGGVLGAYTVKQIAAGDDNKSYAKLETLANQGETVPAGTPVLLKMRSSDPSENKLIPVGNEFISSSNKVFSNLLSGVYLGGKEKNDATNYRVLNVSPTTGKIGFFKLSSSVTYMGANKAFLDLSKTSGAKGTVYIDFDNIDSKTTGITNIHQDEQTKNPVYYDLQGRRVQHPQKGIYIVNGKKVFIK